MGKGLKNVSFLGYKLKKMPSGLGENGNDRNAQNIPFEVNLKQAADFVDYKTHEMKGKRGGGEGNNYRGKGENKRGEVKGTEIK